MNRLLYVRSHGRDLCARTVAADADPQGALALAFPIGTQPWPGQNADHVDVVDHLYRFRQRTPSPSLATHTRSSRFRARPSRGVDDVRRLRLQRRRALLPRLHPPPRLGIRRSPPVLDRGARPVASRCRRFVDRVADGVGSGGGAGHRPRRADESRAGRRPRCPGACGAGGAHRAGRSVHHQLLLAECHRSRHLDPGELPAATAPQWRRPAAVARPRRRWRWLPATAAALMVVGGAISTPLVLLVLAPERIGHRHTGLLTQTLSRSNAGEGPEPRRIATSRSTWKYFAARPEQYNLRSRVSDFRLHFRRGE